MDERLKGAPCGFISMNHTCVIEEVNDTFLEWMDYKQEDVLGKHIELFLKPVNKMIFHSYFYPNINLYGYVEELFIKFNNQIGEDVPYLMNAKRCTYDDLECIDCILVPMQKRIDYELELRLAKKQLEEAYMEKELAYAKLEQIYHEIKEKKNELVILNSELAALSNTDTLTGIPNRRFLEKQLAKHIELHRTERQVFSLLAVDIDYFKKVNDTYGHQTGDDVLVEIANFLKYFLYEEAVVTRFGGEEFIIILPQTNEEQAVHVARQLNQKIEGTTWKKVERLTISIGVATFVENDTEISIMKKADDALYASKKNGRNQVTHFKELHEQ